MAPSDDRTREKFAETRTGVAQRVAVDLLERDHDHITSVCVRQLVFIHQLMCRLYQVTSPIEQLFLSAWSPLFLEPDWYITPQKEIGPYRVDFLCGLHQFEQPPLEVVVECDGHDFHEKTKQQASRDKKRDRYLQSRGFLVLRFAGSEIWRDPFQCVNDVVRVLRGVEIP